MEITSISCLHRFPKVRFRKLRFRDGLVWTVGLTVEIKLRFQILSGVLWTLTYMTKAIAYRQLIKSIAKRTKSKNRMQITEFPARLNISVFWGKYRECWRSFCFTSALGIPAFALKEIFKIIHYSSLFVWVLSVSWRHSRASLLKAQCAMYSDFFMPKWRLMT